MATNDPGYIYLTAPTTVTGTMNNGQLSTSSNAWTTTYQPNPWPTQATTLGSPVPPVYGGLEEVEFFGHKFTKDDFELLAKILTKIKQNVVSNPATSLDDAINRAVKELGG